MMKQIFGTKEMRILMLGLDAAGKTSTLSPTLCCFFAAPRQCSHTRRDNHWTTLLTPSCFCSHPVQA